MPDQLFLSYINRSVREYGSLCRQNLDGGLAAAPEAHEQDLGLLSLQTKVSATLIFVSIPGCLVSPFYCLPVVRLSVYLSIYLSI